MLRPRVHDGEEYLALGLQYGPSLLAELQCKRAMLAKHTDRKDQVKGASFEFHAVKLSPNELHRYGGLPHRPLRQFEHCRRDINSNIARRIRDGIKITARTATKVKNRYGM